MFDTSVWVEQNLAYRKYSGDELVCDCAFCGAKEKLYVNSKKNVFTCFKCGESGRLVYLMSHVLGISQSEASKIVDVSTWSQDDDFGDDSKIVKLEFVPQKMNIPRTEFFSTGPETVYGKELMDEAYRAVVARGFVLDDLYRRNVGVIVEGPARGRTMLPVMYGGGIVYYQAWDHAKRYDKRFKYLNPRKVDCHVGKSQIFYNWGAVRGADTVVLVEGIFNVWAVEQAGYPSVASFGKTLSDEQVHQLVDSGVRRVVVGLDEDARLEALGVYTKLRQHGLECVVSAPLGGGDWNDATISGRQNAIIGASEPDWMPGW